ncbi:MAG: hypothetical protein ACXITV_12380 [Luteibaculaceae bacterium]
MSTKKYYSEVIIQLKGKIADFKSRIASENDRIKDLKKDKASHKARHMENLKNAKTAGNKAAIRSSIVSSGKIFDSKIIDRKRSIDALKKQIAYAQQSLKQANERKKSAK